jgi:hypothetical protein
MCRYVADYLMNEHRQLLDDASAMRMRVRVEETETSASELVLDLD